MEIFQGKKVPAILKVWLIVFFWIYPSMVLLISKVYMEVRVLFCQWVVTAAHCVVFNNVLQSPSQFTGKVCY